MGHDGKGRDAFRKAASGIREAAGLAASVAASKAADAADGAKAALGDAKSAVDEAARKQRTKELTEYAPAVASASAELKGTAAESMLASLAESPLPLTQKTADRVHSSFPVPREQAVIWADAEFDLRPSGIAVTNRGVYIKSDAAPIALPGRKTAAGEPAQSRLTFFAWDDFEPAWCAGDGDGNPVLLVAPECAGRFMTACQSIAEAQEALGRVSLESDLSSADERGAAATPKTTAKAAAIEAPPCSPPKRRCSRNRKPPSTTREATARWPKKPSP